jgi:NADPH2:quinone reductase
LGFQKLPLIEWPNPKSGLYVTFTWSETITGVTLRDMKKILIDNYGSFDALNLVESDTPAPGSSQVLVKVAAAGVNFIDTYQRSGIEHYKIALPFTPGLEGAGVVESVGTSVLDFKPGDRVAWVMSIGSYAEYVLVSEEKLVKVPSELDLKVAAAAMLQGLTAHYLITDCFKVIKKNSVLVHAGAGGTGNLLCQMLIAKGADVIATTSTDEKAQIIARSGVKKIIRYDKENISEKVKEFTDGLGVEVVYDGVGAATIDESLKSLKIRGTLVLFGAASGPVPLFDLQKLNSLGSLFVTRPTLAHYVKNREELAYRTQELFDLLSHRIIDVKIFKEYPLAEAAAAHRDIESRQTSGKLLLIP